MRKILYALRFLTILPIPYKQDEDIVQVARSLALFPLIGLLIGAILWGTARGGMLMFSPLTTGFLLMAVSLILTGGLHLDGLSDLADGLGGGRTRESRLEIMKDSRIGAFGALTLIVFLLMKGLFFFEFLSNSGGDKFLLLLLPPLWARGFVVLIIKTFPPARPEGLGDFVRKNARLRHVLFALSLTVAATGGICYFCGLIYPALLLLILIPIMLIPAAIISRNLGGLTGDCYGALIEGCELAGIFFLILGGKLL
ncbi:MAG: adenosylcobinamide-GDP ribazoletransferase [Spirochaetales bacterium]|nr:adenosylcobinamide-GDP ribazoletransferase [Spirochaetales bacterium]